MTWIWPFILRLSYRSKRSPSKTTKVKRWWRFSKSCAPQTKSITIGSSKTKGEPSVQNQICYSTGRHEDVGQPSKRGKPTRMQPKQRIHQKENPEGKFRKSIRGDHNNRRHSPNKILRKLGGNGCGGRNFDKHSGRINRKWFADSLRATNANATSSLFRTHKS